MVNMIAPVSGVGCQVSELEWSGSGLVWTET